MEFTSTGPFWICTRYTSECLQCLFGFIHPTGTVLDLHTADIEVAPLHAECCGRKDLRRWPRHDLVSTNVNVLLLCVFYTISAALVRVLYGLEQDERNFTGLSIQGLEYVSVMANGNVASCAGG